MEAIAYPDKSNPPRFDPSRAQLNKDTFEPFYVTSIQSLRDALVHREVRDTTPLLVMESDAGRIALLTHQMSYHHVAQGTIAGRPWMVSF